jgi:hypothetical protein
MVLPSQVPIANFKRRHYKRRVNVTAMSGHDFQQHHDLGRAILRGILVAKRRSEQHHRFTSRFDTLPSVLVRSSTGSFQ